MTKKSIRSWTTTWSAGNFRVMCQIASGTLTVIIGDFQKGDNCMSSEKSKKREKGVKTLKLLDAQRTFLLYDNDVYNVREAPPDVFDGWIRQYVEEIVNVDVSSWEIFHRWGIINSCIRGGVLHLRIQDDGSQIIEDFPSVSEVRVEEKASESTSENQEYELPEPA